MKNISKKLIAVSFCILLTVAQYIPICSYAATGTMGNETPAITFEFADSNGSAADGNSLAAGNYSVDVVLAGMASVSMFQMTASYDVNVITVNSVTLNGTGFDPAGPVIDGGNVAFGVYSTNADTTVIDNAGTVMATLSVTVASPCDFESVFTPSTDPDFTFAQADYNDGFDMSYVLGITEASGDYYPMTCDVSPIMAPSSFDISGTVKIATSLDGDTTSGGIVGITVSITDGTNTYSAVTAADGTFTVSAVPVGTYSVTISGPTTIDRTATLTVSADKATDGVISAGDVGIVICDYNKDGGISDVDTALYAESLNSTYNVYCDLNNDNSVTDVDTAFYASFINKNINYSNVYW